MTKQRKLILNIIMSSDDHMTADEIYSQARKTMPSIAIGTVYRNLGVLAETGLIRRVITPDAPVRYDKSILPHEHIVCQKCGKVTDIIINGLKEFLQEQIGIKITGYDLNLRYICDECGMEETNE